MHALLTALINVMTPSAHTCTHKLTHAHNQIEALLRYKCSNNGNHMENIPNLNLLLKCANKIFISPRFTAS